MKNEPEIEIKTEIKISPDLLIEHIERLTEMLEDNPTGSLAPVIATEIERLKELLEKFQ
jgi:hypothetical protein